MNYQSLKAAGVFLSSPGWFGVRPALSIGSCGDRLALSAVRAGQPVPDPETVTLSGLACPYNKVSSSDYGVPVLFRPGVFTRSLQMKADLPVLWDCSSAHLLGRSGAGTASIFETVRGLEFEAQPPDTEWAASLMVSLKRRDVTGLCVLCVPIQAHAETRGKDRVNVIDVADLVGVSVSSWPLYDCGIEIHGAASSAAAATTTRADRKFLADMGIEAGRV